MELPPPNPDFCRLAEKISAMPTELIEGFIKDLPLYRVLELSLAPTAGPKLLWAIENSVAWAGLFRPPAGESDANATWTSSPDSSSGSLLPKLQQLYSSANTLAWNTCGTDAMHATTERSPCSWNGSCPCKHQKAISKRLSCFQTAGRAIQKEQQAEFLNRLEESFLRVFCDCFLHIHVFERLAPLCLFLPRDADEFSTMFRPSRLALETEVKTCAAYVQQPTDDIKATRLARNIQDHEWTVEQAQQGYPRLFAAAASLRQAKYAELTRLADLHERYPTILKRPFAPQTLRGNPDHITRSLRRDAQMVLTDVLMPSFRKSMSLPGRQRPRWYRFRYPHTDLIPYDWCLRLIRFMAKNHAPPDDDSDLVSVPYPRSLVPDLRRSIEGLEFIYNDEYPRMFHRAWLGTFPDIVHRDYRGEGPVAMKIPMAPHALAELEWLESVCRCVEWASAHASTLGIDCQPVKPEQDTKADSEPAPSKPVLRFLSGKEDYEEWIANEAADVLAAQLRADADQCDTSHPTGLPSLLALYLPPAGSRRATEIAHHLLPDYDNDLQQLMYKDLVKKLRFYIQKAPEPEPHSDDQELACDVMETGPIAAVPSQVETNQPSWRESVNRLITSETGLSGQKPRTCYICGMRIYQKPHPTFPSMCEPCGEFNLAGSNLSLPGRLSLPDKTALVTGARVNLGFHTALRLLRCGAHVIATTRYPGDAASRYRAEPDHEDWIARLSIIGADFRCAKDAFALVEQIKAIVRHRNRSGRLDILINNAAQTLTDSIEKEEAAVQKEKLLEQGGGKLPSLDLEMTEKAPYAYVARVRGADPETRLLTSGSKKTAPQTGPDDQTKALETRMAAMQLTTPAGPSSWVQSLAEIPYEDVISAHSVNTFVPLILVRELLPPLWGDSRKDGGASGYIVNVSSREGIFEATAKSAAKNGKHVHTNMSKAGLNMMTETEAAPAWQKYRVAMNTVDPGYMSAAPEYEKAHDGERPIGWEDGAGRVLWPIAMAETGESGPYWGRFLKHYGAKRVDVRLGRG